MQSEWMSLGTQIFCVCHLCGLDLPRSALSSKVADLFASRPARAVLSAPCSDCHRSRALEQARRIDRIERLSALGGRPIRSIPLRAGCPPPYCFALSFLSSDALERCVSDPVAWSVPIAFDDCDLFSASARIGSLSTRHLSASFCALCAIA